MKINQIRVRIVGRDASCRVEEPSPTRRRCRFRQSRRSACVNGSGGYLYARHRALQLGIGLIFMLLAGPVEAALTTNRWFLFSGKWENAANWTDGVPSKDDAVNLLSNGIGAANITVDATTVASNTANTCMTISNLIISGNSFAPHTLFLNNLASAIGSNVMTVFNSLTITANGSLLITNSTFRISPGCGAFSIDGAVMLDSGTVIVTNACGGIIRVGDKSQGTLTVSNGTLVGASVAVADGGFSLGTLTIAGGTSRFSFLSAGLQVGSTGAVWLTGGQLTVSNSTTVVGGEGLGQMTVSNGTWAGSLVTVNNRGTLTIAGGTSKVTHLYVGQDAAETGTVWMAGGSLAVTNNIDFFSTTVTSNQTFVGMSGVGRMTISNGTFLGRALYVGTNTGSAGTFTVAGGTNTLTSFLHLGSRPAATGTVWITGGLLTATNDDTFVGLNGVGQVTISNGTWRTRAMVVGYNTGSRGTLTVAGGTSVVSTLLFTGFFPGATGDVWVTGGQLLVTNSISTINIAGAGVAQVTVSNGTFRAAAVFLGNGAGGRGTLNVAGGTNTFTAEFVIGASAGATGAVWVTDGQLTSTNNDTDIGRSGIGQITVSNGNWQARNVNVARNAGSTGSLTIAGGTSIVPSNMILGNFACTATGIVNVTGGSLFVTNSAGNAALEVRSGTLTISSGTLTVDRLFIYDPCARFINNGGTVKVRTLRLTSTFSTVGDGIPDAWRAVFFGGDGTTTNSSSCAACDPDGDGPNNLAEFTTGTDPNDANSLFRILSIISISNDVRITWTTAPPVAGLLTYNVLWGSNLTTGVTNVLGPAISTTSDFSGTTTNYTDSGGATNRPARFYRVKGFLEFN